MTAEPFFTGSTPEEVISSIEMALNDARKRDVFIEPAEGEWAYPDWTDEVAKDGETLERKENEPRQEESSEANKEAETNGFPSKEEPIQIIKCIICKCELENLYAPGFIPSGGLAFASHGHYGSTVFDPMDSSFIEFAVCDKCLIEHRDCIYHGKVTYSIEKAEATRCKWLP